MSDWKRAPGGAGMSMRRTMIGSAMILLAGCAGAVPHGGARPQTTADRPHVNRPVVQPLPPRQPERPTPTPVSRADPGINRPPPGLEPVIHELWRTFPGRTGISVQRVGASWTVQRRGGEFFPQQSVSKLWVVLAVMDRIDRGLTRLDARVTIGPDDLTLFNQPLAARVQREGAVTVSVAELIEDAITVSDNTANDALLRHAGGPEAVRDFFRRRDIENIRFGPGERVMQSRIAGMEWQQRYSVGRTFQAERALVPASVRRAALDRYLADPVDGAHPASITETLARLQRGELLSPQSTRYVIDAMARTRSGPQRLRGGLPAGWTIAHKTGTGQEFEGRATGYNNVGIVTAPDGTRYTIAVMLAHTTASVPQRMALMQGVARAVAMNHGQ